MKYASKEGVKAAALKSISTIFRVNSICMTPQQKNTGRDTAKQYIATPAGGKSFAATLDNAVKQAADASINCHTCTYGANLRLQNFLYHSKEYTY